MCVTQTLLTSVYTLLTSLLYIPGGAPATLSAPPAGVSGGPATQPPGVHFAVFRWSLFWLEGIIAKIYSIFKT